MRKTATGDLRRGTQAVERTIRVLKIIAARGRFGWRLSDLAVQCHMAMPTIHRLLACLERERLVRRRPYDRHYLPGPLLFELSLALPSYFEFINACQAPLKRIARRTGMVAYLFLRSGADFVCAARQGSSELKALSIENGTRRPLLSAAGGIAILIALGNDELDAILKDNRGRIARFGAQRIQAVEAVLRESRRCGFGLHQGQIVPGVHALGVAIGDETGEPFGSLSVVGEAAKLPPSRIAYVAQLLGEEGAMVASAARRFSVSGKEAAQLDSYIPTRADHDEHPFAH